MTDLLDTLERKLLSEFRRVASIGPRALPSTPERYTGLIDIATLALLVTGWGVAQYLGAYLAKRGELRAENERDDLQARLDRMEALLQRLDDGRKADRAVIEQALQAIQDEPIEAVVLDPNSFPLRLLRDAGWADDRNAPAARGIVALLQDELARIARR